MVDNSLLPEALLSVAVLYKWKSDGGTQVP